MTMSNYSAVDEELYCKPHFEQLFRETGSFTSRKFQPSSKQGDQLGCAADHEIGKTMGKPEDRADVALARVEMEKRLALIKAWEDNEKAVADNKAFKKLSAVDGWENIKRASVEAQMKQIE
ncbi:hypothetical protein CDL12_00005 [Handroanthus impetiginosus]|uniref:Remorin C-terminal domain-containing protein n=1 Tax=Handroanthus impetiginosus TaxID=429701 RepID=A0A2G9IBT6_9LAMI|nr:hypothetical protein CDL12_00005 [Handroanthus impetiginosus]